MGKHVIMSAERDDDTGAPLFWSNAEGWVTLEGATVYDDGERERFPIAGMVGAQCWLELPDETGGDSDLTDPYGILEYAIGSDEDFVCFDYAYDSLHKRVLLHAVLNSETGCYIQDFERPTWVAIESAVEYAEGMIENALDWCADNDVEHDTEGWNQDPYYFARAVAWIADKGKFPTRIDE